MKKSESSLSRREREIMQVLFAQNEATAAEIREQLVNPPTGNAVRATLQILENKGHIVRARKVGREFVFQPKENARQAGQRALSQVLETFFNGSIATALAAHLAKNGENLSEEDFSRLQALIDEERRSAPKGPEDHAKGSPEATEKKA